MSLRDQFDCRSRWQLGKRPLLRRGLSTSKMYVSPSRGNPRPIKISQQQWQILSISIPGTRKHLPLSTDSSNELFGINQHSASGDPRAARRNPLIQIRISASKSRHNGRTMIRLRHFIQNRLQQHPTDLEIATVPRRRSKNIYRGPLQTFLGTQHSFRMTRNVSAGGYASAIFEMIVLPIRCSGRQIPQCPCP
jgi:hypothetical protein